MKRKRTEKGFVRSPSRLLLGAALGAGMGTAVALSARQASRISRLRQALLAAAPRRRREIVILGGGFAGYHLAHHLLRTLPPGGAYRVTLVDQSNYFLFTPLLYHAASGLVDPTSILFPLRELHDFPHFRFREAVVRGVDSVGKRVVLDDGELKYDRLIIALGSRSNFFGHEEELKGVLPLKAVIDAVRIRNRMLDSFEAAELAGSPEERRRFLTFVVAGGGATGVELVGALNGLCRGTLSRHYPTIDQREVKLILCQGAPQLLPEADSWMRTAALERLRGDGLEVNLGVRVLRVQGARVELSAGRALDAAAVIWTAGVRPAALADELPADRAADGRILVDSSLRVPGLDGIYALGDIAACKGEDGGFLPPNAAVAVQQAAAAAGIIAMDELGLAAAPFLYRDRGELVSLGKHRALASVAGQRLTGVPAWIVWRSFYLSQLAGMRNRARVALDWTFAYFQEREVVRMETSEPRESALERMRSLPVEGSALPD